jgi:uncharacterized protein (DUF1684 family)
MVCARRFALCLLVISVGSAAEDTYRRDLEQDRRNTDEFLRSERSPLRLVGRFNVKEGNSTMGSDSACDLVLPPRAPSRLGTLQRQGDRFSFKPAAGVSVSLNGKPAASPFMLQVAPSPKPGDRMSSGDFTFAIRPVGDQFIALLNDAGSPFLKDFHGTTWFPVSRVYRLQAQFEPAPQKTSLVVQLTDGGSITYQVSGNLVFQLAGKTCRLQALSSSDAKSLFVPFLDQTSGKETYGGGRFLEVPLPEGSKTTVDFNKAYNPYCAYNPNAICPVVPPHNRVPVPVRAGETLSTKAPSHSVSVP